MSINEQTRQALWELVYELLPEEDAAALREQICSDPELARAYATVKLESELVASAAQFDDPTLQLQIPETEDKSAGPVRRQPTASFRHLAGQLVALAAAVSIAIVGYTLHRWDSLAENQLVVAAANAKSLQTIMTLPSHLHREAPAPVLVTMTDSDGNPQAAEVQLKVYNEAGDLAIEAVADTSADGRAQFNVASRQLTRSARVELSQDDRTFLNVSVPVSATPAATYLSTDRPFYRLGETALYRSVTLSRFDLEPPSDSRVVFSVLDANGRLVDGSARTEATVQGVASGEFAIAESLPTGKYTLVASTDGADEARKDFFVRRDYDLPVWNKKAQLAEDSYGPADQVVVDFEAQRQVDGAPAAGIALNYQVFVDGKSVLSPQGAATTDGSGKSQFNFFLPPTIQEADAFLAITATDGTTSESLGKPLPINLGQVEVNFFPEGGELVAEVPNRVYFQARDPLGKPIRLEGSVVDREGTAVARAVTEHAGRGRFQLTPQGDEGYRLVIDSPQGTVSSPALPAVAADAQLSMQTAAGVFDADNSLEVSLHARRPLGPLVISASCHGAVVGLVRVEATDFQPADGTFVARSLLRVTDRSAGIIRITLFDNAAAPAKPLVERLVYCRPAKSLDIAVDGLQTAFAAGSVVSLGVRTTLESGEAKGATIGASVVAEGALALAEQPTPQMPTYFYLTSDIETPESLEDADFYLSDGAEAEVAMDLLLGTQGWRQVAAPNPGQFAGRQISDLDVGFQVGGGARSEDLTAQLSMVAGNESSPQIVAGAVAVDQPTGTTEPARPRLRWLWQAMLWGSLALVALVAIDVAIQRLGHPRVWATVGSLAGVAAIITLAMTLRLPNAAPTAVADRGAVGSITEARVDQQDSFGRADSEATAEPEIEGAPGDVLSNEMMGVEPQLDDAEPTRALVDEAELAESLPSAPSEAPSSPPPAAKAAVGREKEEAVQEAATRAQQPMRRDSRQRVRSSLADTTVLRRFSQSGYPLRANVAATETALWRPLFFTDESGGGISFKLPPGPSSYRLRINAHGQGRLGVIEKRIIAE